MLAPQPIQWTLDELSAQIALQLANDGPRQVSGRVNIVPDQRTIRYYTTKGLLAPPLSFRGRTALYGEKHLRQLLAIKRLQARGFSLVDIQQRILGVSDSQMAELAGLNSPSTTADSSPIQQLPDIPSNEDEAFWKTAPATVALPASSSSEVVHRTTFRLAPGIELFVEGVLDLDEYDAAALRGAAAPLLKLLTKQYLPRSSRNSSSSLSENEE
jgi:DNA-binding transcriptional MerR regulator